MHEHYVAIFHRSFERTARDNLGFFKRFYEIFIGGSEEVAKKFANTDMARQMRMLQESLVHMIDFFEAMRTRSVEHLERMARLHSKHDRDIPPRMYELWLNGIVQTVSELDPEFDEDVALAWKMVLSPGLLFMQSFYDRPVPEPADASP